LNKSYHLAVELGFPESIRGAANRLSFTFKKTGNYKEALYYYEIFIKMRDSLNNIDAQKASIKQQTKHEYEKKKAIADKEHELELKRQDEKAKAEETKQYIIIVAVSVVLLLVIVFSVFLYNRFRVISKQKKIIEIKEKETKEQNIIITQQKHLVEEKQKEIIDSIQYAKRIQKAHLPTENYITKVINKLKRS
jgi:hypothetical protein